MLDLAALKKEQILAKGHCRIDYTDPDTGKVLERVEGDNHVFIDQFYVQAFQTQNMAATLLLTDGEATLDTDLPWIPGKPIGYAEPNSSASGLFQGAYRSTDSYINRITQNGVESLYVYDFLTSQIPDTIRYVGLTGANRVGTGTTNFRFRWPRNSFAGIYDIERKRFLYGGTCSLSGTVGGAGTLYIYVIQNTPGAVGQKIDLFTLLGSPDNYWTPSASGFTTSTSGYNATWGYDYENESIVLKLTRYCFDRIADPNYRYTLRFRDDIWVVTMDGSEVLQHFTYSWTAFEGISQSDPAWKGSSWQYYYHFWTGNYAPIYCRLYGDKLYGFSQLKDDYSVETNRVGFYVYQYDITSGEITYQRYSAGNRYLITEATQTMYCYKGYTWGNGFYNQNAFTVDGSTVSTLYGLATNYMGVIPMYDIYNDSIYTYCPVIETGAGNANAGYYLIEKGQSNVYGGVWNLKPYLSESTTNPFDPDNNDARADTPFAYTAYKLPADAPVRPANSAVTIAYGLSITW